MADKPRVLSPSRTRKIADQATSPNHLLFSGKQKSPEPTKRRASIEHVGNFPPVAGGIGGLIHSPPKRVAQKDYPGRQAAHGDHVQHEVFENHGSPAKVVFSPSKRRLSTSAANGAIAANNGIAHWLENTETSTLPTPQRTGAKPAVLEESGGLIGYLAKLEAEAQSRESASLSVPRRVAHSVAAQADHFSAVGGIGSYVSSSSAESQPRARSPTVDRIAALGRGGSIAAVVAGDMAPGGQGGDSLVTYMTTQHMSPPRQLQSPMKGGIERQTGQEGDTLGAYMALAADQARPIPGDEVHFRGHLAQQEDGGLQARSDADTIRKSRKKYNPVANKGYLAAAGGIAGLANGPADRPRMLSPPAKAQGTSGRIQAAMQDAAEGLTRHRSPNWKTYGRHSEAAIRLASSGEVQLDMRRLTRLRRAIRSILPADPNAASATLRHHLLRRDGDRDGKLADEELMRALVEMAPDGVYASDVGFLARYLKGASGQRGQGSGQGTGYENTSVDRVAAFFTSKGEGGALGVRPAGYSSSASSSASVASIASIANGGVPRSAPSVEDTWRDDLKAMQAQVAAIGSGASVEKGSEEAGRPDLAGASAQFQAFRNTWEERYGAPAKKELASDLAEAVEGPNWARADPQPFKVLHLAQGAPAPAAGAGSSE